MLGYKNQLIIFSKNRASQLNLLLDSLKENANNLFDKITVLYKSDFDYSIGYQKLKNEHQDVVFVQEINFRRDFINLIDDDIESTTFMVDDAILFGKIQNNKIEILKPVVEDYFIFSLRLGSNCVYSHPANLYYKLGEHEINGDYLIFDYTKQQAGDFRYPLSTDGHIYNTTLIKDLLIEIDFNNPNTLEANLQMFVFNNSIPKNMVCFKQSKLVSVPVNLVNNSFINRHGLEFKISEKELNDKYLVGEKIDLNAINFSGINGPHKELKYEFKKY